MLAIEVTLLHGTIRAGSADDLALSGQADPGEWPPSPARLFSALVAADGTRERCRVTNGSELTALEQAGPPLIRADGSSDIAASPVTDRFVVTNKRQDGSAQEYVARKAELARPGTRTSPKHPHVTFVWPDLVLDPETLLGLRRRAARVGYLGCADSPVRLHVAEEVSAEQVGPVWEPSGSGTAVLPVPFPGMTEVLDQAFDDFTAGGHDTPTGVRRSWYRSERARYSDPSQPVLNQRPKPTVLWLRFDKAVPGRRVLAVTEALKGAVLHHYPAADNEAPSILHGHGLGDRGYQQAQWLALPRVGDDHADGRIHGAAVWLPPDTPAEIVEGVRTSLHELAGGRLWRDGHFSVRVQSHGGERTPLAANPRRWCGPARRWVSAFPVVYEKWRRGGQTLADATEWCAHAGVPAPVAMRSSRVPLLPGAPSLHPREVYRDGRDRRPYSHIELSFAEPISGPVVLGRARQFGLGLMTPVADRAGVHGDGAVDG